jgi:maltose O-acetyltransferase
MQFRICLFEALSNAACTGSKPKILQPVLITGPGKVVCETNVTLGWFPSPDFWSGYIHFDTRSAEALITLKENSSVSNSVVFCCKQAVSIGKNALIGANVQFIDFDGHEIHPDRRRQSDGLCKSITIGDNVWIGSNVMILKGVSVGDRSIIGAGSIVTGDIPAGVVAAGNPCRVIKPVS